MATEGVDAFLRAEDEANQLVEELAKLKNEVESYRMARESLDKTAQDVTQLTSKLGDIAGRLGGIVETLRSIGTAELLRQQKAATDEVSALRQDLTEAMDQIRMLSEKVEATENARQQRDEAVRQAVQEFKKETSKGVASIMSAMGGTRNLSFSMLGLLLTNLVLVAWIALSFGR